MAVTMRGGACDPAGVVGSVALLHGGDVCGRWVFEEAIFVSLTVFVLSRMRKRKTRPWGINLSSKRVIEYL